MSTYTKLNEYGYVGRQRTGHKVCKPGKRVIVELYKGQKFVDKFKMKEGRFHYFFERGRMKSNLIKSVSIVTADFYESTINNQSN